MVVAEEMTEVEEGEVGVPTVARQSTRLPRWFQVECSYLLYKKINFFEKMTITTDITELKELEVELKRLKKQQQILRQKKEDCERRILQYLDANEQPGVKMGGMVVMAENRRMRKYQKKSDKLARGEEILERIRIDNSRETLDMILEAMRGEQLDKPALRMIY